MDTRERQTETFYFALDDCDSVSIQAIARAQERSAEGVAFLYDDDGENIKTAFRITRITDGRGRYYQCDGKLKIADRALKVTEYPLIWKPSNLGVGGFWMVQGANHTARKIYRTPRGWLTLQDYRYAATHWWRPGKKYDGHYLYRAQRLSRETRTGRTLLGMFEKSDRAAMLEDEILQPCRKLHYRGKLTPYGRRILREYAKRNPQTHAKVKQVLRECFPDDCNNPVFELRFIRELVKEPRYTRLEERGLLEHYKSVFNWE